MIGDPPTRALDLALRTSAESATVLAPHLADLLQSLAHDLLDHIEEIAETVNARAITHEPLLADPDDPLGSETTMQSTRANVGAIISMLAYGVPADAGQPAVGAMRLFERMAEREDGLAVVLRGYRVGVMELWQIWTRYLATQVDDPGVLYALTAASTSFMLTYIDRVSSGLHDQWRATRRRHRLGSPVAPEELVRLALSGPPAEADLSRIGYDLGRTHIAVALDPTLTDAEVRQLASRLALEADACSCELHLGAGWVLWLGLTRPPEERTRARVRALLEQVGTTVGTGDPAPGVLGFRSSYREALDARRVGMLRRDPGVTIHRDVALLAVLCADTDRARALAQSELGPLGRRDAATARLRETLTEYLRCGENQIATAYALGVHHKTVAYRLRQAEALLGRRVGERRAELEAALLLDRVFAADPADPAADRPQPAADPSDPLEASA